MHNPAGTAPPPVDARLDFAAPAIGLTKSQLQALEAVRRNMREGKLALRDYPCPLCSGRERRELDRHDMYGLPTVTSLCLGCAHVYQSAGLDGASLSLFYGSLYRPLDRPFVDPWGFFEHQRRKGLSLIEYISSASGSRLDWKSMAVLELGTGAGGILKAFEKAGATAYGCDLDAAFIRSSQDRLKCRIRLCEAEEMITWLAEREIKPDIIILEQVLEHILDPGPLLRSLKKIAKKGTLLYIGVPGLERFLAERRPFRQFIQIPHVHYFTRERLEALFNEAGYSLIQGNEDIRCVFTPDEGTRSGRAAGEPPDARIRRVAALLEAAPPPPRQGALAGLFRALKGRLRPKYRAFKCYRTALAALASPPPVLREVLRTRRWIGRHVPAADRLPSRDRIVLENVILPRIVRAGRSSTGFKAVLVGAHQFSYWYGPLLGGQGISASVLEVEPTYAGIPGFIQGSALELSRYCGRCDVLLFNGVFNYGVDTPDQIDAFARECEKAIAEGGAIIVGYREGWDDAFLSRFRLSGFLPASHIGLPAFFRTYSPNDHTFVCLKRISPRGGD